MTLRWMLVGLGTWLLCGATPAIAAPSEIVIAVGNATASSPGTATFTVTLSGLAAAGVQANNAQVDIIFDTTIFAVPATGSAACMIDPRLASLVHTETLPSSPPVPPGMRRLRLSVIDFVLSIGVTDGTVTTLQADNQNVGDFSGNPLSSSTLNGTVTIVGPGEISPTVTRTSTPTPTPTRTPTITPTSTPTTCPVGDQTGPTCAALGVPCNCVDDCATQGFVFGNEVTIAVNIVSGSTDLSACPSADADCDGDVFGNEVTIGVNNVANGCPGVQEDRSASRDDHPDHPTSRRAHSGESLRGELTSVETA
jgi:hypothetical protein